MSKRQGEFYLAQPLIHHLQFALKKLSQFIFEQLSFTFVNEKKGGDGICKFSIVFSKIFRFEKIRKILILAVRQF